MKVYLIYKHNEDGKKDTFMSFHANENLAKLSIGMYKEMYIHESEMTENEYNKFYERYKDKELVCLKHHMHIGFVLLRRIDLGRLLNRHEYIYDKDSNKILFKGEYDEDM